MSQSDPPGPALSHYEAELLRAVGWYRHPDDSRRHRYWDGEQWHDQAERPDALR